ncbi:tyrosine-type recombinase/integrase [Kineosporia sp. J2-2]|uniref:Tyrosine-type recombinase/integrase n=1 Tax=Kineosporia corallincola TaxID=2835133 RepID=A0ABS5TMH0_9ACTN|nr:tyrosine-type recombinase/integrase [Kineosporia corallincola]MBT0771371.1 tyrosine-type recombinase/integrase [Kineosporia corallincola]
MANKNGHRRFGAIRKLPSGRYQARYPGPDGRMRKAPETFARKPEAERFLTLVEAQMLRHEWIDPDRGKVALQVYGERWIDERPNLRPRTVQLYRWTWNKHIVPFLGARMVNELDPAMIRTWRSDLLTDGVSIGGAAKAYRLLRAVLNTALDDELIRRNPCRIKGADQEKSAERPTLTLRQVFALVEKVPARYRALLLVAAFGSLRWGEVSALKRRDVNVITGTVRVREAYSEIRGRGLVLGPPKSRAGARVVALPAAILPVLREHVDTYVKPDADALVFTTGSGRPILRGNFNKLVRWHQTVASIGATGLHFHDLRHTGNVFAAKSGTSLRDLMTRMGHDSPRAAMIYQHATAEADTAIAAAINAELEKLVSGQTDDDGGAAGASAEVG